MALVGASVPIRDPLLGRELGGKYRIEAYVGGGAMGRVYRARQVLLDKVVAVKVLHTALSADERVQGRFQREARAASRLSHPNSAQTLDFGIEDDGVLYLVMEYLEGPDLSAVLEDSGPQRLDRIVSVMSQVLGALAAAHDAGIIHRDLKPENILLVNRVGDDGAPVETVKVADFGIAKMIEKSGDGGAKLTDTGLVPGTPAYMSPEQAGGRDVDARTDLYSCGVILFEMATGQLPFMADTPIAVVIKHITQLPPFPSEIHPGVDPELEQVILKCLAKDPAQRYGSARELRAVLRALADDGTRPTAPGSDPRTPVVRRSPTRPDGSGGAVAPAVLSSGAILRPTTAEQLRAQAAPSGSNAVPHVATEPVVAAAPKGRGVPVVAAAGLLSVGIVAAAVLLRPAHHPSVEVTRITPVMPTQTVAPPGVTAPPTAAVPVPIQPVPTVPSTPPPTVTVAVVEAVASPDPMARHPRDHGRPGAPLVAPPTAVDPVAVHAPVAAVPTPAPVVAPSPVVAPPPAPVAAPAPTPPPAPAPVAELRAVHGEVASLMVTAGVAPGAVRSRADRAAVALAACVQAGAREHGGAAGFGAGGTSRVSVEVVDRRVDAVHINGGVSWASDCGAAVHRSFEGDLPEGEDESYRIRFEVPLTPER